MEGKKKKIKPESTNLLHSLLEKTTEGVSCPRDGVILTLQGQGGGKAADGSRGRPAEGLGTGLGGNKGYPASRYRPPASTPTRPRTPRAPASKSRPRQHYYSLGCVRRMGRQIRGTLRLPEPRGGFSKVGGRPRLTPAPAWWWLGRGLHLRSP